jgi:hypothetical protein
MYIKERNNAYRREENVFKKTMHVIIHVDKGNNTYRRDMWRREIIHVEKSNNTYRREK